MRKPTLCISEIKDTDQLHGYLTVQLINTFNFVTDSISEKKLKPPATFCGCTAQFVSDFFGNPEVLLFEPCPKKSCCCGFQPGQTQTKLYSYRNWLET